MLVKFGVIHKRLEFLHSFLTIKIIFFSTFLLYYNFIIAHIFQKVKWLQKICKRYTNQYVFLIFYNVIFCVVCTKRKNAIRPNCLGRTAVCPWCHLICRLSAGRSASNKAYPFNARPTAPLLPRPGVQLATREGYSHSRLLPGLHRPRLAVGALLWYLAPSRFFTTIA